MNIIQWIFSAILVVVEIFMITTSRWWFASIILVVVVGLIGAWIWLKENLPLIAGKENPEWFVTVKKGKIIAIKVAGRIVGYYGNLFDLEKRVDRKTGQILPGKDDVLEKSMLWKEFGAIWMGFGGSLYTYPFEKMDIVEDKIIKIKTTASSIFLKNRFIVSVDDAETKEMIAIKIVIQLITETVHAGLSLNYDNWISVIKKQVESACRDFIATKGLREITKEQLEKGGELFNYIMDLNDSNAGNTGLPDQIGQKIIAFSVISLEIADPEVKKAVQSEEVAKEEVKGMIARANGEATVIQTIATAKLEQSRKEAEGIKVIGNAKNNNVERASKLLGKQGAENLEKTRALANALENLPGLKALSFGAGGSSLLIGDSEEKITKEKTLGGKS